MSELQIENERVIDDLGRLENRLETFLSVIDEPDVSDESLFAAWSRCQVAFADLGDLKAHHARVDGVEREALENAVERVQRLNAIATASLTRAKEEIVTRIEHAAKGRQAMGGYGSGRTSRSFDAEG